MIRAQFITEFAHVLPLAAMWQRWSGQTGAGIFQSWGFTRAFWEAHGAGLELRAIAVERDGEVIGVLPLQLRNGLLEFLGAPESDGHDVLCEERDAAAVVTAAVELLATTGLAGKLMYVQDNSSLLRAVAQLPGSLRRHLQSGYRCPAPTRALAGAADKRNASELRRLSRKLATHGEVSFERLQTRERIRAHLPHFFDQHIARAAAAGRSSEFVSPERRAFLLALVEHLDPTSELHFAVVSAGGNAVAYHAGLLSRGRLIYYRPSFDIDYWDLKPGNIMLRNLIAFAEGASLAELDFSIGDEPYKQRFANGARHSYVLHFEPKPLFPAQLLKACVRAAEGEIRRRPEWIGAVRAAKSRLAGFRSGTPRNPLAPGELYFCLPQGNSPVEAPSESLSTLASLCGRRAPASSQAKILEARVRLKAGHRFRIFQSGSDVAVVWIACAAQVPAPWNRMDLPPSSVVAYECWRGPALAAGSVSAECLPQLAASEPHELWISLAGEDRRQREWLEAAGVRPSPLTSRNINVQTPGTHHSEPEREPEPETVSPQ